MDYKLKRIASHNTMSYLKPDKWYMIPFRFIGKCQSLSIFEQYKLGIRMFDLRVIYDDKGHPKFAHGAIVYKDSNVETILWIINNWTQCSVRIVLECNNKYKRDKYKRELERQTTLFRRDVDRWLLQYPNIRFFECTRKFDWFRVKVFKKLPTPKYIQKIGSMSGKLIYKIWPRLYAMLNNKHILYSTPQNNDVWTFVDFVGKYDYIKL